MLVLSRKIGETIVIGENIRLTVLAIQGNKVRIGIDAPPEVRVDREEVARRIQEFAAPRLVEARWAESYRDSTGGTLQLLALALDVEPNAFRDPSITLPGDRVGGVAGAAAEGASRNGQTKGGKDAAGAQELAGTAKVS